jgi:hypothetical protein
MLNYIEGIYTGAFPFIKLSSMILNSLIPFKLGDTPIVPLESSQRVGYGGIPQFERGFPFINNVFKDCSVSYIFKIIGSMYFKDQYLREIFFT